MIYRLGIEQDTRGEVHRPLERIWTPLVNLKETPGSGILDNSITLNYNKLLELGNILGLTGNFISGISWDGDDWDDDAWDYFRRGDTYRNITKALKAYLSLELAPYEKYNPGWYNKGKPESNLIPSIPINDYLEVLRMSGLMEKRDLNEEDLEALLFLGLDPDVLKLVIGFALGNQGNKELEGWLGKIYRK